MKRRLLPYQFSLAALFAVVTAVSISLALFRCTVQSSHEGVLGWPLLTATLAASFMGGTIGAAIGHVFRDERGGQALLGAYFGALAGPPVLLALAAIWAIVGFHL
jgi:hypothetical protein